MKGLLLRVCATVVALAGAAGCCSGSSSVTPPPMPVVPPVAPAPPVVPVAPGAPPPPACITYCERLLACHVELGTTPRDGERDCTTACSSGGAYASLAPAAWACSTQTTCNDVWGCAAADMAEQLLGSLGSHTPSSTPPADWPADFPVVPGGTSMPSPPMGPVHVAILAYAERTPSDLAEAYRTALGGAGWTIPEGSREADEEAERFVAQHAGASVSVSVYREGAQTYVQTMQVGSLFPH